MAHWKISFSILCLLLLGLTQSSSAWGPNGHRSVGLIAERNLTPVARHQVEQLLGGESLASVSNWADWIRSFERWNCSSSFHYTNIPPGSNYQSTGVPREGDVLGAIAYFYEVLENASQDRNQRADALRFLVHFIGDLHQPLHVGLGCDRGGNDVVVEWRGEESRLHSVWDSGIYEAQGLNYSEFVGMLRDASAEERKRIQSSSPIEWARESQELLGEVYRCSVARDHCPCLCGDCQDGYSVFGGCSRPPCQLVPAPVTLGYDYQDRAEPIVRRRIQEAGLRLAAVLNWALTDETPSPDFTSFLSTLEEQPNWNAPFRACAVR